MNRVTVALLVAMGCLLAYLATMWVVHADDTRECPPEPIECTILRNWPSE